MTGRVALPATELQPHHHAIIDAVRRAGGRLVAMQPSVCDARNIAVKADGTIITVADIASEEILPLPSARMRHGRIIWSLRSVHRAQ